jgi:hypothetical protein
VPAVVPVRLPPGLREAFDKARRQRVTNRREHDRDVAGRLLGRDGGRGLVRDDHIHLKGNQLRRLVGQRSGSALGAAKLQPDVVVFAQADLAQTLAQRADERLRRRRAERQHAHRRHPRLLRPWRQRPSRRAADGQDEFTPSHA